jgi:Predicted membrane protein
MYEIFIFIVLLFVFLYLKNAIDRLRDEVDYLHAKLEIRKKETSVAAGQSVPLEKMQAAVETIPLEIVQEPPAAALEQKPAATIEAFGIGPEKKSDGNLEFKIGSKIFTSVGVVAVICAVGFFLRYAFENGLIDEFGRVVLGVAAGIILLIIGEITRKHYLSYSHALTGGGLGVLYVSFYAGFAFYRLMAQPAAFFCNGFDYRGWHLAVVAAKFNGAGDICPDRRFSDALAYRQWQFQSAYFVPLCGIA